MRRSKEKRKPDVRDKGIQFRRILPVIQTISSGWKTCLLGSDGDGEEERNGGVFLNEIISLILFSCHIGDSGWRIKEDFRAQRLEIALLVRYSPNWMAARCFLFKSYFEALGKPRFLELHRLLDPAYQALGSHRLNKLLDHLTVVRFCFYIYM